jgi:holo-[acyl-carrier protein] synthase
VSFVRRLLTTWTFGSLAGIGVDACEIARVKRALADRPARGSSSASSRREQAYCDARGRARYESYAARFAAKEAAMKGARDGLGAGPRFHRRRGRA